jgi:hypothetical protein
MSGVDWGVDAAAAAAVFEQGEIERVQAHPAFEAGARQAVANWLPLPGQADLSLLRDLGRFLAATWACYLDATPGGVTRSRLQALAEATGVSSSGRAAAMLIYLRFTGYIEPAADQDSRVRRFAATPALAASFGERMRRELAWSAALDPGIAELLARFDEPAVRRSFLRRHGENTAAAMQLPRDSETSLDVFSHRLGGMIILGLLLQAADHDGAFPAQGPVRFSVSGLAAAAETSRSHVRNQLRAAEKAGLLAELGEGQASLTPALAHHVRLFIASVVLMFAWDARRVLTDVGDRAWVSDNSIITGT